MATYESADGTIAFAYPANWSVAERDGSQGETWVGLLTSNDHLALDIRMSSTQGAGYPSTCDGPEADVRSARIFATEPVEPLTGALAGTSASPLTAATFLADGDFFAVSLVQSDHAADACIDQRVEVAGGTVSATTPYGTDAELVVYRLFEEPQDFLVSVECSVILGVVDSLRISGVPAA